MSLPESKSERHCETLSSAFKISMKKLPKPNKSDGPILVRQCSNFVRFLSIKYLWYSFGIPFVLLFLLFFIQRIIPFGTDSATLYDSCHQYVPFLTEYHNKLMSGETLMFSMSTGLGQDFWLIWSYYLSSPFNLLLLFFKNEHVIVGMNIITIILTIADSLPLCKADAKNKEKYIEKKGVLC